MHSCRRSGHTKKRKLNAWYSPLNGFLKFSADKATRGKLGLIAIGIVLRNFRGKVFLFSKRVGVQDLNEAEMLAILEALRI